MKFANKSAGFTLLELMMVVLIVSILAAVAYPVYTSYLTSVRRTDGKIALLTLASGMERYFAENGNSYKGATLAKLHSDRLSAQGHYMLSIAQTSVNSYLLQATPLGAQAKNDSLCQTLTIDQLGQKGQSGSGPTRYCW